MRTLFKTILLILYVIRKISWLDLLRYYNRKSPNIIYLSFIGGRYGNEILSWDLSAIEALIELKMQFRCSVQLKGHKNATIFWSPSQNLIDKRISDYASELILISKSLEENNNRMIPSSYEISFLENKAFMYQYFKENDIRMPETIVVNQVSEIPEILSFPLLIKGEHSSGSHDIYKINSKEEMQAFLIDGDYTKKFKHIIIQQLLDIRTDLRVTIVGNEVVLSYWRINPTDEWKPTASSFGGTIKFTDYPNQWHEYILNNFKKLNIGMGAFDVTWDHDDLNSEPYFLEVSPRFSPNPVTVLSNDTTYKKWKKKLFGRNPYYKAQCDLIFSINKKYISNQIQK